LGAALLGSQLLNPSLAAQQPIRATIDVTRVGDPINPLMYGQFVENLGNRGEGYWEGGVWAELLGDRKFFYPVNNDSVLNPPNSRSRYVNRWWVIGPESAVVMDSVRRYVGKHSPHLTVAGSERRGVRQDVGVRAGKDYTGRIVLAGDSTVTVHVTLVWGPGAQDRQTVTIGPLLPEYRKFPLAFTPSGDNPMASFEITGAGQGSFLIGAVSLMPADNVEGWNRQVLDLVRATHPTTLRWGGNFSSNYEWRDGIGDMDQRPPMYDYAWNSLEPNDVGTFEVLMLNELLSSEPNIGVNSGLGDAWSAAEWVEYVNGAENTPMGRLRAAHGHPAPFDVKWWGIGNEMYGVWQIGHMSIDDYVIKHNQFAERMRAVDPSIILVASGATLYQQSADARGNPHTRRGEKVLPPFEVGSVDDWSAQLLLNCGPNIDYVAEHIYGTGNFAYNAQTGVWDPTPNLPLADRLRKVPNRIEGAYEMFLKYEELMPWLKGSGIKLVLDEWHGGGNEVFTALWAALGLNELFRHTDVYEMSAHTSIRTLFNHNRYDDPQLKMNGLVFGLYTEHFGSLPILDIGGSSPQPTLPGTPGVDRPENSSGSPTYPLDVMAALSADRSRLTIAVVNQTEEPQQLQLEVQGTRLPRTGRSWTVAAPGLSAANVAGRETMIRTVAGQVQNSAGAQAIAPLSVSIYEFQLQ